MLYFRSTPASQTRTHSAHTIHGYDKVTIISLFSLTHTLSVVRFTLLGHMNSSVFVVTITSCHMRSSTFFFCSLIFSLTLSVVLARSVIILFLMCRYNDFRALISNDNGLQTSLWPIIAEYSLSLSPYPIHFARKHSKIICVTRGKAER